MKTLSANTKPNSPQLYLLLLFMLCMSVVWGQLPNEIIDKTFDSDGLVTTNITSGFDDVGYASVIQTDGKIVVAGKSNSGSGNKFAVARYNENGSLDNTFGTSGYVTTSVSSVGDEAWAVALQSDGKIVVAGYSVYATWCEYGVVRYNSDGSLDTSFDSDGIVTTSVNVGTGWGYIYAIAIQEDGKIIIAGSSPAANNQEDITLVRYNTNGSLDTTGFTPDGIVTASITGGEVAQGIAVQEDGKIVVGGYSSTDKEFLVLRFNSDGSPDTGFGSNGIFETSFGYGLVYANSLDLQEDEKIILVGSVYNGTDMDCATMRFTTAGALDNTFDSDGLATVNFNNGSDYGEGVAVQGDGKIVVASSANNGSAYKFGIVRYLTDGSLDQGFGDYGKKMISFGTYSYEDWPHDVSLQDDGKIVVVGHSTNGTDDDFSLVRLSGATQILPNNNNQYTDNISGIPLSTYDADMRHQSLYSASELSDVGIPANSTITAVEIIPSAVPSITLNNFRVGTGFTANTSFSDWESPAISFGPTSLAPSEFTSMEWYQIDVDDITWNGTDNLVLEISHDNSDNDYSSNGGVYLRETGINNRAIHTATDYGVYPFDGNGYSTDQNVVALRLLYEVAAVLPASNMVLTAGDAEIDLSWTASGDGDLSEYIVFRGTTSNNLVRIDSVNSGTTSYTDDGLVNGTTYYYGVKAKNSDAELSEFTNIENTMPEYSGPVNITVANSDTRAALNWEAPGGTIAAYFIYRGTSADPTAELDSLGSGTTYYFDEGLTNGTAYFYRLKAKFSDGSFSSYSENYVVTPNEYAMNVDGNITDWANIRQIHNDPVGDVGSADIDSLKLNADGFYLYGALVTASDLGNDLVSIYFDTDFNATTSEQESDLGADYKLTISPWGTNEFLFRNQFNNWESDPDADFNIISANGNQFHEFSIHLDNLDGPDSLRFYLSSNSNDKAPDAGNRAYILDPNDAPRNFFVGTGDTKANLNWKADNSSGYSKYYVYRGTSTDPTTAIATITGGNPLTSHYMDSGLTNGTTYYYRIRGQYADNSYSDYTESIAITPGMYVVNVDGNINDWSSIRQLYNDTNNDVGSADIDSVKLYADDETLYGTVVTTSSLDWDEVQLFIDSDFNAGTGESNNNLGADYQLKLSPNSSDIFRNYNGSWQDNWDSDFTVVHANNNQFHEFKISLDYIGDPDSLRLYYRSNSDDKAPEDDYYLVVNTAQVALDPPGGLTALADSAQVTLRWNALAPANLHKYYVYRDMASPAVTLVDSLVAASPPDTFLVDDGLTNDQTYFYAVSAVDSTGRESEKSAEIMSTPNRYHQQVVELLHTNTSYSPTEDSGYPFNTVYSDVKHQSLYLAQDFTEAGIPNGAWLSSIDIKPSAVNYEIQDFRLALGATNNTTINTFTDLEDSVVHGPLTYNQSEFTDNTWKRFSIDPYYWNGTSNLILEASVDRDNWGGNGGVHIRQVDGTRGYRGGSDGASYPFGNMGWTAPEDRVLALQVVYSTVEPVGNFQAVASHQSLDLSWNAPANGSVQQYIVYSGASVSSMDIVGTTSATSYTVDNLTNGNTYYVGVQVLSTGDEYSGIVSDQAMPEWIGPRWYVNQAYGGPLYEGSPDAPYTQIQDAIDVAPAGDTVYVLPGRYNSSDDQYLRFVADDGFSAKNLVLMSRGGPDSTVIDGEYNGTSGKRLFDFNTSTDSTSQVIGFKIVNGGSSEYAGAAVQITGNSQVVFKNCVIDSSSSVSGPAIFLENNSKAWFRDCVMRNNERTHNEHVGGGVFALHDNDGGDGCYLYLDRCQLVNNAITSTGQGAQGGAVYVGNSTNNSNYLEAVNTVFAGNSANSNWNDASGSAIYSTNGNLSLINCTVTDNSGDNSAIGIEGGDLTVFNTIIWGNTPDMNQLEIWGPVSDAVSYSIIENGDPDSYEGGVLNADPEFADYSLHDRSPAIGAGRTTGYDANIQVINAPVIDIEGTVRPNPGGSNPDMGAYENALAITPYPSPPNNLASEPQHQAVGLTWSPSDSMDVVKYYVYQSTDSASWTAVDTAVGYDPAGTVISGLTNNQAYWFAVTSVDGDDYESSRAYTQQVMPEYQGPVWYVNVYSTGPVFEGSPDAPFDNIQDAIDASNSGTDTVMVLPIYEDVTYERSGNWELDPGGRNIVITSSEGADSTVLLTDNNHRHFWIHNNESNSLIINGFTFKNSANDYDSPGIEMGGSVYIDGASPVFTNCVFGFNTALRGGAVYIGWYGAPQFHSCKFLYNHAYNTNQGYEGGSAGGGAVFLSNIDNLSGPVVIFNRCLFNGNTAEGYSQAAGGAVNLNARASFINNLIVNNKTRSGITGSWADSYGGGLYIRVDIDNNNAGEVKIINTTIANDSCFAPNGGNTHGGGIYMDGWPTQIVTMFNSILWGNHSDDDYSRNIEDGGGSITANYNLVENGAQFSWFNSAWPQGNLSEDPVFTDPGNGDYTLDDHSGAIGAGVWNYDGSDAPTVDITQATRVNVNPDLGPYENPLEESPYPRVVTNFYAEGQSYGAYLDWDANPSEDDLAYYAIYQGTQPGFSVVPGDSAGRVDYHSSQDGNTVQFTIEDGLLNGVDYYFVVIAVNNSGYRSLVSAEVMAMPEYMETVWFVDVNNDSTVFDGSPESPFPYLLVAFDKGQNGDTIMVAPGEYSGSNNRGINLWDYWNDKSTRELTLLGEKGPDSTVFVLSGVGGNNYFMDIRNLTGDPTIHLEGLTIRDAVNYDGGAVSLRDGSLTITDCVFDNNATKTITASGGGALWLWQNANVDIDRSLFKNNSTSGRGGAINLDNMDFNLTISNSIFYQNDADDGGGAIFISQNNAYTQIVHCTFTENHSNNPGWAGAVHSAGPPHASVINSVFWDNTSGTDPGDLTGSFNTVDHNVLENSAGWPGENYTFDPMLADAAGGDFSLSEFSPAIGMGLTEYYDYFTGNVNQPVPDYDYLGEVRPDPGATSPDLGAIEHWRSENRKWVWLVQADGTDEGMGPFKTIQYAIDQSAPFDTVQVAAGTYSGTGNVNLNFWDTFMTDNKPVMIRTASGPEVTVIELTEGERLFDLDGVMLDTVIVSGLTIRGGNLSAGDGGAIRLVNSALNFANLRLTGNNASGMGGAIHTSNSYASFTNCEIFGNSAANGGAAFLTGGMVGFDHCTFYGNRAGDDLGIVADGGELTVRNSVLWNNTISEQEIVGTSTGEVITVEYCDVMGGFEDGTNIINFRPGFTDALNGDFTIEPWSFILGAADTAEVDVYDIAGNLRPDTTGADLGARESEQSWANPPDYTIPVFWYVSSTGSDDYTGDGTPFATIQRAADYALYTDTVYVGSGTYTENIIVDGKPLHLMAETDAGQTIIDGDGNGCVIDITSGGFDSFYLDGFTIRNGVAESGGGVSLFNTSAKINNCVFTANSATDYSGGGLWAYKNDSSQVYTLDIVNSDFSGNTAANKGAGLRITDLQTTMTNCTISGNSASYNTGIHVSGYLATLTMEDCRVLDNQAATYGAGGGISNGSASLTRVLFAGNIANTSDAGWNSGGLSIWGGADVEINNSTFTDNSADFGSGLAVGAGASATINHSIFWGNTPDQLALDVWEGNGGTIDISWSLAEGGQPAVTGTGDALNTLNWDGTNRTDDPAFGMDYTLLAGSPAINGGNPDSIDSDGTRRDMGFKPYLTTHSGPVWYVDAASGSDVDGQGSEMAPFASVQAGVNFAPAHDTVSVAAGIHIGQVKFYDTEIVLTGVGDETILDGAAAGPVVHITDGFTTSTVVNDLVVTGAPADQPAVKIDDSDPELNNIWVRDNAGDGIYVTDGSPTLNYCLITDNAGDGLEIDASSAINTVAMVNNTISGNDGTALNNGSASAGITLRNSIVYGNGTASNGSINATYSDIAGIAGTGNLDDVDPLFVDPASVDYSLQINSPCIDAGDPTDSDDPDGTPRDMGALFYYRSFAGGTTANTGTTVTVSTDTTVVVNDDWVVQENDTLVIDPGATVFLEDSVSIRIDGALVANGNPGEPIQFRTINEGDYFNGIILMGGPATRADDPVYSYMLITDVNPDSIPLTVNGNAILEHVTIAGNGNATSLTTDGTVNLRYSILEGGTTGVIVNDSSFVDITEADHFVDFAGGDYALLPTSSAIDVGIDEAPGVIDPDFTYSDAGAYYHDQSAYPVFNTEVVYPAFGETVDVSPDTSSDVGAGLAVATRFYNMYGNAKTNANADWSSTLGSFALGSTDTTDLDGVSLNTFYTSTMVDDQNTFTVSVAGVDGTSGTFNVVPGAPDTVLLAGTVISDTNMVQLDELVLAVDVKDQFDNLVSDGEAVNWTIDPIVGDGTGFVLGSATTTTTGGLATVTVTTDPNTTLAVGDRIRVQAESNGATVYHYDITIVPDDIYNLTMPGSLTDAVIDLSADIHSIEIAATMIDTFDNPLENVAVNWAIVDANNVAGSLTAISTLTDASGVASVTLTTGTVTDYEYKVLGLVQEEALLAAISGNNKEAALQANGVIRTTDKNGNVIVTDTQIPVMVNPITVANWSRVAIFDLNDTTNVIRVVPGIPDAITHALATDTVMTQREMLEISVEVFDQFGNLVEDGSLVSWELDTLIGAGDGFTFSSATSMTSGGVATVVLSTAPASGLEVGQEYKVIATCEGIENRSGLITVVVDDPYSLALEDYERTIEADFPNIPLHITLLDTFDNFLDGIPIYWSIIEGTGGVFANGKDMDTTYTGTEATGWASDTLHLSNLAGSAYKVRVWTDNVGGYSPASIIDNRDLSLEYVPAEFADGREVLAPDAGMPALNLALSSVFDLDDTTDVITVLPGAPNLITSADPDTVYVVQGQVDTITVDVFDAFGNDVSDGSAVAWNPTANSDFAVLSQDNSVNTGQAQLIVSVGNEAAWLSTIDFSIEVQSVFDANSAQKLIVYVVEDVIPPAPVTAAAISPAVWTPVNDFDLSWTNPAEHSGVAGVYYQIDDNAAAYVAGDDIAELVDVAINVNGKSTLKVWLEDKAGNSDSDNAVELTAKWDNVAPDNFDFTYVIDDNWLNIDDPVFTWNHSSDATAGLREYRIELDQSSYTVEHMYDTLAAPVQLSEAVHTLAVFAVDSAGNDTIMNGGAISFDVDYTNPTIAHNIPEGTVNSAILITATIADARSGVDRQTLYYRQGGQGDTDWQSRDLTLQNQIPSTSVTSAGVEYYIEAEDVAGNIFAEPETGFHSIEVSITGAGFQSSTRWPLGIPNGGSVSDYQLISFPGIAADNTPTDVLVDDFGTYDDTKWRFFTFDGTAWQEFANITEIEDGVGYFLITKDADKTITTGQTRTVVTNESYEIAIPSGQWIVIGNPFGFDIPLSNIYDQDDISVSGNGNFKTWDDGAWIDATNFEPWRGYIYKSTNGGHLYINPRNTNGGTAKILADGIGYLEDNEWLLDIEVTNGFTSDRSNQVGMLNQAADGYDDRLDYFEPPVLPGGVSLRIDNRDWEEGGDFYTSDIRSINEDGHFWDMEIEAGNHLRDVDVDFLGLEDVPDEFDIFLVDLSLNTAQNLRGRSSYTYAAGRTSTVRNLRLLVGTKEYVSENSPVALYPEDYSLSQNFPNPFNPRTTILISIEEEAFVDLVIYNLLGEEVYRLARNEYLPSGYYNYIWNGRNSFGKRAASGIYFYTSRITSPDGKLLLNKTRKMVLVK